MKKQNVLPPSRFVTYRLRSKSLMRKIFDASADMKLCCFPYTRGQLYYIHILQCVKYNID